MLRTVTELDSYIKLNDDPAVQKKRQIRMALRALDGQTVYWPYNYTKVFILFANLTKFLMLCSLSEQPRGGVLAAESTMP